MALHGSCKLPVWSLFLPIIFQVALPAVPLPAQTQSPWFDDSSVFNHDDYASVRAELLALQVDTLPKRSGALAGILSAIIPGVGSFYAGNSTNGGIHLAVHLASIGVMVAGYSSACDNTFNICDESSGAFIVASSFAFVWFGNWVWSIVSGVNDASTYNRNVRREAAQQAQLEQELEEAQQAPKPAEPAPPIEPPPTEPRQPAVPAVPPAPDDIPIGYFSVGYWQATVEPPGFPSYTVRLAFYSVQEPGQVVGSADYESASPCSYDLILEYQGTNEFVVAQQLISGDCANGTRVLFTRSGDQLQARWLRDDRTPWFEATFTQY